MDARAADGLVVDGRAHVCAPRFFARRAAFLALSLTRAPAPGRARYAPEQVPVKAAVARAFGVFNKLYTAVPGPSSPNHLFTQSATSCGMQRNGLYDDCGGKNVSFPQKTIYDSLREHNVTFGAFMNSTCGLDGKPCHGEDPITDDSPSAISTPDVAMEGVARYKERFFSQEHFYAQAAAGTRGRRTCRHFLWDAPPIPSRLVPNAHCPYT